MIDIPKNELEWLETVIALTERAEDREELAGQLHRLTLAYLAELSEIPYREFLSDKPKPIKVLTEEEIKTKEEKEVNVHITKEIEVCKY